MTKEVRMDKVVIDGYISEIRSNRMGDRSEKVRMSADYESAGIIGNLTFEMPILQAKQFYIGQKINIIITASDATRLG